MMTILPERGYVQQAEAVIKKLKKYRGQDQLTTSKIRSLLSISSSLFDESKFRAFEDLEDKIAHLHIQLIYQAGRTKGVKALVEEAQLVEILTEVDDIPSLQRFCRYMEALVAYFKYEGNE